METQFSAAYNLTMSNNEYKKVSSEVVGFWTNLLGSGGEQTPAMEADGEGPADGEGARCTVDARNDTEEKSAKLCRRQHDPRVAYYRIGCIFRPV